MTHMTVLMPPRDAQAMMPRDARIRAALTGERTRFGPLAPPMALIISVTARRAGLNPEDLRGSSKIAPIVNARHAAMWLCRHLTKASTPSIGRAFKRDHSTVVHALQRVEARLDLDLLEAFEEIRQEVERRDPTIRRIREESP